MKELEKIFEEYINQDYEWGGFEIKVKKLFYKLESELDELKMDVDILEIELEKEKEERNIYQKSVNTIYAKRTQELQTLKEAVREYIKIHFEPNDDSFYDQDIQFNKLKELIK